MIKLGTKQNIENSKPLPSSKGLLFKAIAVAIPLVLLLTIEIALRLFSYGNDLSLFAEYPADNSFMMFNPSASRKYFNDPVLSTTGNIEPFQKEKDANTLRIFILGESTTIGYPYFHNGSFHRWLQYRLINTFPHRKFEIINLSLTAVNSYTVLGFARELVPYKPDAVLIYTGHNEYYGTLGVASTESVGNSRVLINVILALRDLRLVQWMTNVYASIGSESVRDNGTRMKLMVAQEKIPYNSQLYYSGIEQFESNMDNTIRIFNERGIPVFISNLVSNEGNMEPFINEPVDTVQYPTFSLNFSHGMASLARHDTTSAYLFLKKSNHEYGENTLCNYYLGQLARAEGDVAEAKKYFAMARDLDGLRFRAPSSINDVIERLCQKYPNAHLVDTESAFEHESPDKIIGDNLMLEHVHPNLTGYAILSDAFYKAMKVENIFSFHYEEEMTFAQLLASMPITPFDSLVGACRVAMLKRSWPFNKFMRNDSIEIDTWEANLAWQLSLKKISWQNAMDSLYQYYVSNQSFENARKVVEGMVLEHPIDQSYYEGAAMLNGKLGNTSKSIMYFEKAFELSPTFNRARYLLVLYLKMDEPLEALMYINYAIGYNVSTFDLAQLKKQVEGIVELKKVLEIDSMNVRIINQIAKDYLEMDNVDGAKKYLNMTLRVDNQNSEAIDLSVKIENKHTNL